MRVEGSKAIDASVVPLYPHQYRDGEGDLVEKMKEFVDRAAKGHMPPYSHISIAQGVSRQNPEYAVLGKIRNHPLLGEVFRSEIKRVGADEKWVGKPNPRKGVPNPKMPREEMIALFKEFASHKSTVFPKHWKDRHKKFGVATFGQSLMKEYPELFRDALENLNRLGVNFKEA